MTSYNFGPIEVDPEIRENFLQFEEISLGLDRVIIDDYAIRENM